ncbi:ABC transporter substrate-binding protein [Aromatoleum toluclasticum]|uniref:ABC transporter substrate-binding protein n=1 Tax=Aromatoleum toluclasticum TaxID=92003 RepID=UPI0003A9D17D|nr:ABC transporter substrate-binding protein [Aromatoleum toluclasticum]
MKTGKRMIAAASVMATLFAAPGGAAQAEPQRGGNLVFAVSMGEPATFDCHAAGSLNVMFRVAPHYSTLLQIDPARYPAIVGDLAESWTVSDDGLLYTFKLRPNVRFHDGSALTSADVRASFERMRNPPPGVVSVRKELYADIASIDTPDAATVVFRLSEPNVSMLAMLAQPYGCIYSDALLKSDPAYPAKKVIGSGPFRFVSYTPGAEWVGERFPQYFRTGLPYLDGFKALSLTTAAMVNALAGGQVMVDFRGVTPLEAQRIVATRGKDVNVFEANPAITTLFMATINTARPGLDDARVRRALALALDHWEGSKAMERTTTVSAVGGLSRPGSEFARSNAELEKLAGFSRNIEAARAEARRLLAEADKTNLKLVFLNRKPWPYMGTYLIDQFRQIGVTMQQEQVEDAQFFARRRAGDFDLVLEYLPDYLDDPTAKWSGFLSYDRNPNNLGRFSDHKLDALLEAQSRTADAAQRLAMIRGIEEYVLDQAYALPLFWGRRTTVVDAKLQGYVPAPTNYVGQDLAHYWLRQ